MYAFGNTNQQELIPCFPSSTWNCSFLSPPNTDGKPIFLKNSESGQYNTLKDILIASIHEMADLDSSVNKNCFFQTILLDIRDNFKYLTFSYTKKNSLISETAFIDFHVDR